MEWEQILQIISLILTIIAAVGGSAGLIQYLKSLLKLEGTGALILSWIVTGIIATLQGLVMGEINPEQTWLEIVTAIVLIFLGTEKLYRTHARQ